MNGGGTSVGPSAKLAEQRRSLGHTIPRMGLCVNPSQPPPIMNFNKQHRKCFVTLSAVSRSPERSEGEGSLSMGREMLRCAQGDMTGFGR